MDGGGEIGEAEVVGDEAHEVGAGVGGAATGDAGEGGAEVVVGEMVDLDFPGFDFAGVALQDLAADGGADVAAENFSVIGAEPLVAQL